MFDLKSTTTMPREEVVELIATKLLGWTRFEDGWAPAGGGAARPWDPFASKDDAWLVIDEIVKRRWLTVVKSMPEGFRFILGNDAAVDPKLDARHVVELNWMPFRSPADLRRRYRKPEAVWANTVEEAILNAGLLVIAIEEEEALMMTGAGADERSGT